MNIRYHETPEIITTSRYVDEQGEDVRIGDRVTGVQVMNGKDNPQGLVQLDIRDFTKGHCLIVEIELPELMAALSCATLNATRD